MEFRGADEQDFRKDTVEPAKLPWDPASRNSGTVMTGFCRQGGSHRDLVSLHSRLRSIDWPGSGRET